MIEWQGSKKNNMCFDGSGPAKQFDGFVTNLDSVSVVRDDAERDPAKRYKMINHWESIHCWDNAVSKLIGIVSPAFGDRGPATTSIAFAPRCLAAMAL